MMGDIPDFALIHDPAVVAQFPSHPHGLVLLPDGLTIDGLIGAPCVSAVFLIDRNCGFDVLNGTALAAYVRERAPIRLYAQRARDLRPFLRRAEMFKARGYAAEVLS